MSPLSLNKTQAAWLRRLEDEGPLPFDFTPDAPAWFQALFNLGFIERHEPRRFRITDKGREALIRARS